MGKGTRSVVPTRVLSTELIATYGAVPGRCPEQSKHRKDYQVHGLHAPDKVTCFGIGSDVLAKSCRDIAGCFLQQANACVQISEKEGSMSAICVAWPI